ncbi:HDOD domain-containing protein [Catenovulum maritimum]|uniref:HDOD domain-containing protein n=1 Tax=Catenovulum maritimum TaxID=1513271 RepID=A0A0J8JNU9_9ALTE|nr:HDOD domain-containing protein [Catenovulum maritimum]KMT66311.1 hypothetical protein XM47_04790 [Catenovulum maritimum]
MPQDRYSDLIDARFHDLLLSYDFARQHNSLNIPNLADVFSQETNEETRLLLDIEQEAKEQRDAEVIAKESLKQAKSEKLNKKVVELVSEQLDDIETIYNDVIAIHDAVPAILDILSVRAASIGRIEPLISTLPWMGADMLKFVNLPVYRKPESDIKVDKVKTALSYIGIENLKLVVPSFALRKWIPHSTEPFRLMKRKLWESGIGAAISCRKLAQLNEQDTTSAFCAGMFHDLGKSALVRIYLRSFDNEWKRQLLEARESRDKTEHDALVELEPDPATLRNIMLEHSAKLSAKLVDRFNLKRLRFVDALEQFSSGTPFKDYDPLTRTLAQGVSYSRYKMLQKHSLIAKHEAKIYFKENLLTSTEISELNKLSLLRLNLRIEQH